MSSRVAQRIPDFSPRPYQLPFLTAMDEGCKRAVLVWHRRCLSGDSHILMANGSYKLLKDIKEGDQIISYADGKLVQDRVKSIWSTGEKECVVTSSYEARNLTLTKDHRILTSSTHWDPSWKKFDEIKNRSGITFDEVHFERGIKDENLAEFLGYLMTDSSIGPDQQPKYTSESTKLLDRVEELASLYEIPTVREAKGNCFDVRFIGVGSGGKVSNRCKEILRDHDICRLKKDKRIPEILWKMDKVSVGKFFSSVIDCDGCIYVQKTLRMANTLIAPKAEVKICVGESEELAWDYYWLLRKFGIHSGQVYNDRSWCWTLRIWESSAVKKFLKWITTLSKEDKRLEALALNMPERGRKIHLDNFLLSKLNPLRTENKATFDLETECHGNFIADGYIVHNSGKEVTCFNHMIKMAFWHRVGTYIYFFPTSRLGRRILWDGMDKEGKRFLDYIPKNIIEGQPNSVEMKIRLTNGSTIQIMGTDMIVNVGVNPVGCVFSEFSLQDPYSWNYTRPILRENGGWAVFNFTSRGHNHAYDLYLMAKNNPDWFCQLLTIDDTKVLSSGDIEEERREGMSEHMIRQEYFCDFSQGTEGSYYAKLLNRAEIEGRITNVPYDPMKSVDTYWDLGVGDETVILFVQNVGQEIHIIDMYRNQGEGLNHYAKLIKDKAEQYQWVYGDHYAPHDIQVRELGSGAQTRLDIARDLGISFMIVPKLSIAEGIELCRGIFPRIWIDSDKCKFFIKCMENYHKQFNERLNVYSDRPVHNFSSHTADAFRSLGVMQNKHNRGHMSEEDANKYEQLYHKRV